MKNKEEIFELLKLISDFEAWEDGIFHWYYKEDDFNFRVYCNDLFCWALADCQYIETKEDIKLLRECFKLTIEDFDNKFAFLLYCCKKVKKRPQGAYYKHIPKKYWKLFDDCGSLRKVDFLNPHSHPNEKKN